MRPSPPPWEPSHTRQRLGQWLLLCMVFATYVEAADAPPNVTEQLTDLIFDYRAQNGLSAIPVSPSLSAVAALHVADLERNPPKSSCNAHSWSENPRWTACCYTRDHAQARCMWDKPREITRGAYTGHGFEIVCWNADGMTAGVAMDCWRRSAMHHSVILNRGEWRDTTWRAMGVGVSRHYAVIWLGREVDIDPVNRAQASIRSTPIPIALTIN